MKSEYQTYQKRGKIVLIILLCSLCIKCNFRDSNRENDIYRSLYIKGLRKFSSMFPKELLMHFPAKGDSLTKIMAGKTAVSLLQPEGIGYSYVLAQSAIKKSNWEAFRSKIEKLSVQNIRYADSCKLFVYPFYSMIIDPIESFNTEDIDYIKDPHLRSVAQNYGQTFASKCPNPSLPVPFLSTLFDELDEVTLEQDFELYIIEAEQGKFLDNEFMSSGLGMPPEWKNGYTRGVALDNKNQKAFYWLIIW